MHKTVNNVKNSSSPRTRIQGESELKETFERSSILTRVPVSGGGSWCCINNALSLNGRPCFAASPFVPVFTPRPRIRHAPQHDTPPSAPGAGAPSDTRRQIFKWRSLILTIPRPFVNRRLNKDEMEFLCLVTNRGKGPGVKSMRICEEYQ